MVCDLSLRYNLKRKTATSTVFYWENTDESTKPSFSYRLHQINCERRKTIICVAVSINLATYCDRDSFFTAMATAKLQIS